MNSAYSTKYKYQVSPSTDNFDFWTNFSQKVYFWSYGKKMNSIIELSIFELDWLPNFNLNYFNFDFSKPICSKRVFSV